jgi:hypothetical protein
MAGEPGRHPTKDRLQKEHETILPIGLSSDEDCISFRCGRGEAALHPIDWSRVAAWLWRLRNGRQRLTVDASRLRPDPRKLGDGVGENALLRFYAGYQLVDFPVVLWFDQCAFEFRRKLLTTRSAQRPGNAVQRMRDAATLGKLAAGQRNVSMTLRHPGTLI